MKSILSRVVVTLAVLFAQLPLLLGCELPPVSNDQIAQVNKSLDELTQSAKAHSLDATRSVDKAYQDITVYLQNNNFSSQEIQNLEATRSSLKAKSAKLRGDLNKIRGQSDALFSLLKRRAEENRTPDYKEAMQANIGYEENRMGVSLKYALDVNDKIDASIQLYDDLLGYLQVAKGLQDGVRLQEEQINIWLGEAARLNKEVQDAIYRAASMIQQLQRSDPRYRN